MTHPYFQTPLQTADYNALRGTTTTAPWESRQFITLCKNTLVFAARVNGTISSSSFAQITFDTVTTGAFGDVQNGETFYLSHTNDIRKAYYRGRIRAAATSTLLKVNETSVNITDNDYIFVVYDFDGWDILSRMVGSTQYQDFDKTFHPLPPVAVGLRTAYTNYDPADGVYRVAFDVSHSYAADMLSSSTLTYQFTFVGGTYTVISGALNTAVVTVDFNANTEQWGKLVVTDSQGTILTRRFYIRAHGSTDTPALDFSGAEITGNLDNGWNATVSAWAGVQNVLNQTFCVIWSEEWYNNVKAPLSIANNIDMVGRFHREDNNGRGDPVYSYVAGVKFDVEGICTQMQRLQEQDLTTIDSGSASAWDQISFNTPQRSIIYYLAEHSTFLSLCDLTFPSGFDNTFAFQYCPNQGGNVLDAIKGIAKQFNANVEFSPDGRIQVVRDTRFLSDKSAVADIGDFDNRDFTEISSLSVDPVGKTGRLDAYGDSYNGGRLLTDRSRAPGAAQGSPAGQNTLDAQILASTSNQNLAKAELNYRGGQQVAIDNLTYVKDWKAAHGGYHFLIPSRGQRVTHTLGTGTNLRGLSFGATDYWQIVSVTINHDNEKGNRAVTTHEELEPPPGDSGDDVPQIAGGVQTNPILLQPLDPFPALPDDPGNYLPDDPTPNPYPPLIPPKDGSTGIYTDGSIADTSRSVLRRIPTWTGVNGNISLGSFAIKDVTFDRTSIKPPIGAYVLVSDGTDSKFIYTTDAFASPVFWTEGATFSGLYNQIRSAGVAGGVLAYSEGASAGPTSISYVDGSGPASFDIGDIITITSGPSVDAPGTYDFAASFSQCTDITVLALHGFTYRYGVRGSNAARDCSGTLFVYPDADYPLYNGPWATFGYGSFTPFTCVVRNNGALSGNAHVIASNDYGISVSSPISVGPTPGARGALDLEHIGGVSIAAASGQVKIATTLGGAYSNAAGGTLSSGQPVTLAIPVRRFPHGATQYTASDPDYLLAGDTQISSAAVWKVNGTSGVKTDITPTAGAVGIGPNLATIWQTSSVCYILIVVNVGGAQKLYRSLDAGATWSLSKTCSNAIYLRYKRNSPAVLYLLDGSSLFISLNHGATWLQDTLPSSETSVALDMYS